MKIRLGRRTLMLGTVTTLVVGAIALAVLGAGGIVAWEYSNSNAFCTNNCHAVHPEEPRAYAVYSHARVQCVECHMGRLPTLQLMTLKAAHYHELLGMITGYQRPLTAHDPAPGARLLRGLPLAGASTTTTRSARRSTTTPTPKNTETRTRLVVHTGSGEAREKATRGIHWHIDQNVEYVTRRPAEADDSLGADHRQGRQDDDLFRRRRARSRRAEMDQTPKRRMECADCHNAAGPPVRQPGGSRRRRDRSRARSTAACRRSRPARSRSSRRRRRSHGPMEEQVPKFQQIIADAAPKGEMKPEVKAAEAQFANEMLEILKLSRVRGEGPHVEDRSRTTSATRTPRAASAATTASTSTRRARRSGCSARCATTSRRSAARAASRPSRRRSRRA